MISLEHAKLSDRLMRATTSLTVREFDELASRFATEWEAMRAAKTAAGDPRVRRPSAGPKGCLASAQQKLFFILLYYKAYPTQDVMGLLFGITQGQVSDGVGRYTAVMGQLIPLQRLVRQARELAQLLTEQPELREVIMDGTEQRLPRPEHRGKQKRFYSGRKKRHAVKNDVIVGRRKVLWCSPTVPARKHDKMVADQARLRLPDITDLLGDSGFEGLEHGAAGVATPNKRHRGCKLLWRHRRFNRMLSGCRIPIEHTFAPLKRVRILRDEFRNRREGMIDQVVVIGCTLHNFRCERRGRTLAA